MTISNHEENFRLSLVLLGIKSQYRGDHLIRVESHRAARYAFSASIELIDVQSEQFLSARIRDLSVFGCFVSTMTPFPAGRKVSLRVMHAGATLVAVGKIVSSKANSGMGIVFTKIEPAGQAILEKWLSSLRSN